MVRLPWPVAGPACAPARVGLIYQARFVCASLFGSDYIHYFPSKVRPGARPLRPGKCDKKPGQAGRAGSRVTGAVLIGPGAGRGSSMIYQARFWFVYRGPWARCLIIHARDYSCRGAGCRARAHSCLINHASAPGAVRARGHGGRAGGHHPGQAGRSWCWPRSCRFWSTFCVRLRALCVFPAFMRLFCA